MDSSGGAWGSVSWLAGLVSPALLMWAEESALAEGDRSPWIGFIDVSFWPFCTGFVVSDSVNLQKG